MLPALPALPPPATPPFVPACSYYHGTISRDEAVKRMQAANTDGAFLLRMSEKQVGVYTITLQ